MWPSEIDLSLGLHLHEQRDECNMWSRISLTFWRCDAQFLGYYVVYCILLFVFFLCHGDVSLFWTLRLNAFCIFRYVYEERLLLKMVCYFSTFSHYIFILIYTNNIFISEHAYMFIYVLIISAYLTALPHFQSQNKTKKICSSRYYGYF